MSTHSLVISQCIPCELHTAWQFFGDPVNLPVITPPYLNFKILRPPPDNTMYAGQIIEYKLRPFLRWSVYWMTEITHVVDQRYFIDEQRFGPYRFWHHQHHFRSVAGGIEMTDIVHYRIPFGPIGDLAHWLWLKRQISRIFDYRHRQIEILFGKWPGA